MATPVQSFRLDGWTTGVIDEIAERLNITRTEVVELAVQSMLQFGLPEDLAKYDSRRVPNGYSGMISMVYYRSAIEDEIGAIFEEVLGEPDY